MAAAAAAAAPRAAPGRASTPPPAAPAPAAGVEAPGLRQPPRQEPELVAIASGPNPRAYFVCFACVAFLAWLTNFLFPEEPPKIPPRVVLQPPGPPPEAAPWQTTPPAFSLPGPFGEDAPVNLVDAGFSQWLGGPFSFMVTMQMNELNEWSRIFDFGVAPDWEVIGAGTVEKTTDFYFSSYQGGTPTAVSIPDFFVLEKEVTLLLTISATGNMKVYQDGELIAENPGGQVPHYMDRPHLTVGSHHKYTNQGFRGTLRNVKVWTQEVTWDADLAPPPKSQGKLAGKPAAGKGRG